MSGDGTGHGARRGNEFFPVSTNGASTEAEPQYSNVVPIRRGYSAPEATQPVRPEDIYPEPAALPRPLATALRLLPEASSLADEAARSAAKDDFIGVDDAVMRLKALLPELFACRTIGDGFGMIINAVFWAATNADKTPFTRPQADAVAVAIRETRNRPLLQADDASRLIEKMEDAELNVEPAGLAPFANLSEAELE